MVFSDPLFLFVYLPFVLGGYFLLPKRFRNCFLFLVSLVFYACGEPKLIWLMLFSITFNYAAGLLLAHCKQRRSAAKIYLVIAVTVNIGLLAWFKYAGMIGETLRLFPPFAGLKVMEIPLPVGISFYTFQAMSYIIDVYRGLCDEQRSYINFGAYITMFPQLIAGPIVRFQDITRELEHRKESMDLIQSGIILFLVGLGKKVLLANPVGALWDALLEQGTEGGLLGAWVGMLAYTLQIYFDFSGYSDMARGLGRMLGFHFLENFNYPYTSKSVSEFWRRWHISLGTWFREYVYIPLGGNRCSKVRNCINLLVVWLLTGLWHGAAYNFLLWGLYYGILLMIEKLFLLKWLKRIPQWISRVYTLLSVMFGWMLFAAESLSDVLLYFQRLFTLEFGFMGNSGSLCLAYAPLLLLAVILSTPILRKLYYSIKRPLTLVLTQLGFSAVVLLLSTASLVSNSYNPFLYFKF